LRVLYFGTMISVGNLLKRDEREAVSKYLGNPAASAGGPKPEAFCKDRAVRLSTNPAAGSTWNGWSGSPGNSRFQAKGLTLDQTSKLKLKWAYGFDGDIIAFSQPTVIDGTVFVGSASGLVQALEAKTGCTKWVFQANGPVRAAITVSGNTLLFGDQVGWFYAVNAITGKQLWRKRVETHEAARMTAAATVSNGIVYVPVASWEETRALSAGYPCCTFRGSLVALRVSSGAQVWKTYMIPEPAKLLGKTPEGLEKWGPSGAAIWTAPTVDTKRGVAYVTTSDNYSEPATETSDAVVAVRLRDGRVLWSKQTTPGDIFSGFCVSRGGCPGPDFDFASSAILVTAENGRDLILAGQKSGIVYALDPDKNGAEVWQARVGKGGVNGGVQWGMASDGQRVYAANSDVGRSSAPNPDPNDPRPVPFDPKQGGGLTALRVTDGRKEWYTAPVGCPADAKPGCSPAQSSAVTAMPGVIFSAALDGHLRAFAAEDGRLLWDFDTVRSFDTVNGVRANGGAIDGPGAVVAGGMVFVNSGYARTGGMAGNVLLAFGPEE
jgi:polyvinyl alcohol dehydrogenase (cytochrome)